MSDSISRHGVAAWLDNMGHPELAKAILDTRRFPSADRPTVDKEYLINLIQGAVYDGEACAKLIDLVDRPTGKWIQNDNGTWSCNLCHSWIPNEQHFYAKYCLFCGAKMYKGGDDE